MAEDAFYRFLPAEGLGKYAQLREAVQFVLDNYWKCLSDEGHSVIFGPKNAIENIFPYVLAESLGAIRLAKNLWPAQDFAKVEKVLVEGISIVGKDEALAIALLYGEDLETIHHHMGDIQTQEFLAVARGCLDNLLELRQSEYAGAIYRIYKKYHSHVGELIAVYDGKATYTPKRANENTRHISELQQAQAALLEELWLSGLLRGRDYNENNFEKEES